MERRLIDRFTEDFESCLSPDKSREQSFQEAKKKFEQECKFTPYLTYNSYRTVKKNKSKRMR